MGRKSNDNYRDLKAVLAKAVNQAAEGKGRERHAGPDEDFSDQQICQLARWIGPHPAGGPIFQACKKLIESGRIRPAASAIDEILGAINYAAAAVIILQEWVEREQAAADAVIEVAVPDLLDGTTMPEVTHD